MNIFLEFSGLCKVYPCLVYCESQTNFIWGEAEGGEEWEKEVHKIEGPNYISISSLEFSVYLNYFENPKNLIDKFSRLFCRHSFDLELYQLLISLSLCYSVYLSIFLYLSVYYCVYPTISSSALILGSHQKHLFYFIISSPQIRPFIFTCLFIYGLKFFDLFI